MVIRRVLSLDGGGVRGISSLLILRHLLVLVSQELGDGNEPMVPLHVFDTIVGTSTGGLIALMLVKLKMSIDDCIRAYEQFSKEIFRNPHRMGKFTRGIVKHRCRPEYMHDAIHKVMRDRGKDSRRYEMEDDLDHATTSVSVVCAEITDDVYQDIIDDPVLLCSHHCRLRIGPTTPYANCLMSDAAKATSAAPSYFPAHHAVGKRLIDGGFGTNNPSAAACEHYYEYHDRHTRRGSEKPSISVWVNIGTGLRPRKEMRPTPGWIRRSAPQWTNELMSLLRNMKRRLTSPRPAVKQMELFALAGGFSFDSFSADGGVHKIGLHKHEEIQKIRELTENYLKRDDVRRKLEKMAQAIAEDIRPERAATRRRVDAEFLQRYRAPTNTDQLPPVREVSQVDPRERPQMRPPVPHDGGPSNVGSSDAEPSDAGPWWPRSYFTQWRLPGPNQASQGDTGAGDAATGHASERGLSPPELVGRSQPTVPSDTEVTPNPSREDSTGQPVAIQQDDAVAEQRGFGGQFHPEQTGTSSTASTTMLPPATNLYALPS